MNARRLGTFRPCRAASRMASGLMPSMEINMTNGLPDEVPVAVIAGDAATRAPIKNRNRKLRIGFKLPRSIREPAPAEQSSSDRTQRQQRPVIPNRPLIPSRPVIPGRPPFQAGERLLFRLVFGNGG